MNKLSGNKLRLSFLAFLFLSSNLIFGQTVKGKVSEAGSSEGMSGVTVVEVNQNDRQVNGTNTDKEGNYTIKISNPANRLRFSYISFITKTESINGRSTIDVQLVKDTTKNNMADVVVVARRTDNINTGLGATPKRDLIGAVSSIKAEVMAEAPVSSIDQMIQGRAAGVQVVSNSGEPGAGVDIRIRGAGSIAGGNDPLFIIDGIAIISSPNESSFGGNSARINPIADINPSDIERIDILKDANAAAIYGARAANGVIVITTKRGKPGRTDVTFSPQFTINQAPPAIKVLDGPQYKVMRLEALQNQGNINPLAADLRYYVDDPSYESYLYFQNNTNWVDAITKTGFSQNYNVSVSSAGEAVRYLFTTSFLSTDAPYLNTFQRRFTTRFNLDYKVSDKLRFSANLYFARQKRSAPGTFYEQALKRNPSMPIYDIDVNGNTLPGYFSLPGNGGRNPVAYANTVTNNPYSTNFKPNIQINFDILKSLSLTSNLSLDFVGEDRAQFIPPQATGVIWNDGAFNQVSTSDYERRQMIIQNYLTYLKSFGTKFKTTFLLGNEFNTQNSNTLELQAWATGSSLLNTLGSAGGRQVVRSSQSAESILSNFAKASLVYDDKYGVNAMVRRDGSSKFGGNNKYANFPSFGAYWRVSNEPFFENLKFLTDLKLRASWGQLGNSGIPNYRFISQFAPGANYLGSIGVTQQNPELNDLRWETIETTNLGLDMDLFKSRLIATIEVYNKNTKDLLYNLNVPTSSGLAQTSILTNLGTIRNRGIEVQLDYNVVKGKKSGDFDWNISFNMGRNENKVTSLPGGIIKNPNNYAGFGSQVKEGDPLGTYYGLVFNGVYATDNDAVVHDAKGNIVYNLDGITPKKMRINSETGDTLRGGDAIYEDFNHDGIINDQDRVLVGNANASFFGGLNTDFNYKGFSFKIFIQYQYGNDIINGMRYQMEKMDNNDNQAISVLRRWRKQGDITDMPKALNGSNRNSQGSTRWIEDGSYARLKQVTLSYRFANNIAKKLRMKTMNAYFTGSDLFTITNYTGADPEIQLGSDPAFIGADRGLIPRPKSYLLGFNFTF